MTSKSVSEAVPGKHLAVEVFRAAGTNPNILSVEIGDHSAWFSGGGGHGELYATTDGKKLHRRQAPDCGLRGVKLIGDDLWITGEYGTIAVSTDLAASWDEHELSSNGCIWDVARDAKGVYWAAGQYGTVLRSTKRGAWKPVEHKLKPRDDRADPRVEVTPAGVTFPLFNAVWDGKALAKLKGVKGAMSALAIAPSGTVIMVGDAGAAFRSVDGGASYKAVSTGTSMHLEDVAFVAGGFIAVGDKGTLRRSEDDGGTWKSLASNTKEHLWSIGSWGTGAYVGGDGGLILKITAPGDTYWKGAVDQFAPKPIVAANITPLEAPKHTEKRFAQLYAEAQAAVKPHAAKVAQSKFKPVPGILAALDDVEEYKVYGDALQQAGDLRGELIALQTSGQDKAAKKYLKTHRAALLGGLAEIDEKCMELEWENGFIKKATVKYYTEDFEDEETEDEVAKWVATLLDEPSAQFLQELTLGLVQIVDNSYEKIIREIGRRPRPALRNLYIGEFDSEETEISWSMLGDASKLCGACTELAHLTLRSGNMTFGKPGQFVFPTLKSLTVITGGLTKDNLKSIVSAHLPSLETLRLYLGTSRYGGNITRKEVDALLKSDRFPRLAKLGLANSEIADELCQVLHLSPLVAQIKELDLSQGTLSDLGANHLATYAKGLQHLETLDISESYVSPAAAKLLQKALPHTKVDASKPRGGGFERRYVSISE